MPTIVPVIGINTAAATASTTETLSLEASTLGRATGRISRYRSDPHRASEAMGSPVKIANTIGMSSTDENDSARIPMTMPDW